MNAEGLLEICKEYSAGKLKQVYLNANHPTNENINDLLLLKIQDLKTRAGELGIGGFDARKASSIRNAIRSSIDKDKINLQLNLLPIDEEGMKQIWEQIEHYLPLYALFHSDRQNKDDDTEIQNPFSIAIKKALREEVNLQKLNEVRSNIQSSFNDIANKTIEKLREMHPEIANELNPKFSDPKWDAAFKDITVSSDNGIPINKRGSGVRRLILLNFFRAEAEKKAEEKGSSNIIYAFEEPETSQHPDNQLKLIKAFIELSQKINVQIILTTHSPGIANLLPLESLRLITKQDNQLHILYGAFGAETVFQKISTELGILPDIQREKESQLRAIVCVEGPNDIDFLHNIEHHFDGVSIKSNPKVMIIPLGGSTLKHWVNNNYLRKLGLPEVHIYDSDKPDYQEHAKIIKGLLLIEWVNFIVFCNPEAATCT